MTFKIPKTLTKTLYVQLRQTKYDSAPEVRVFDFENTVSDYNVIAETLATYELNIDLPEFEIDLNGKYVEALKQQKTDLLAKAQHKADQIDVQIQNLLAIEYEEGEA